MVRDAQVSSEQPEHARGEALGLAEREAADEPQRQHQLDRRVRVPGLATRRGPPWGLPSGHVGLVQPECQVAAPLQPGLVLAPVPDAVAGPRDAAATGGAWCLKGMSESVTAQPLMDDPARVPAPRCTNAPPMPYWLLNLAEVSA
jgi:hypothetical protein